MKHAQYRKYKEVYQIDINIIIQFIKQCDNNIQIGGEQLYMYIPIFCIFFYIFLMI
jgi:hypothetical protein